LTRADVAVHPHLDGRLVRPEAARLAAAGSCRGGVAEGVLTVRGRGALELDPVAVFLRTRPTPEPATLRGPSLCR